MKLIIIALGLAGAIAGAAQANDKPAIGLPPGWVKPIALPADTAKPDETAVRMLLFDQQVALEPGRETVYSDIALKIQTPQGLSAGNISFPWSPDTDVLTVHKLVIHRGSQVIDVLASGQTFTVVRREQNLDSAALDGVLTANIQPEGLQVGDIVEFAASIAKSDPTLKGHVEQIGATWNDVPITRAHMRIQWPSSMAARLRQSGSLPALKPVKTGGGITAVELSLDNVVPILPPKGAPARYAIGRVIELTDFASWADLGALMGPLYEKAAVIAAHGPLHAELERIEALSPDPKVRAEAALALVQDRVRYVALSMGTGGYVPADADVTWSRRFGDCKGKSALLVALLHAMGIQADPVAVSSDSGDGLDARLPMVRLFDHVIVRATIGGHVYWLDGTRTGDTSLDRLKIPLFHWAAPLTTKGGDLIALNPPPLETPISDSTIRIDASAGLAVPAPTRIEMVLHDDSARFTNEMLSNLTGAARDRTLHELWQQQYDFVDVKTANASFDPKTAELHLTMEGEAKLDWANGNYQTDGTNVGYRADFSRDPGPDHDAPFAVPYPYFTRVRETIILPKGVSGLRLGSDMEVAQTAGGIEYRRHAAIANGIFTIEKSERSVVPEFPGKDAAAEQAALRMLADRPATLRMPATYSYTGKDIAAVRAETPATSAGYVNRARAFLDHKLRDEALRDYDKAVELDPGNGVAWALRGITRIDGGDLTGARNDLNKAMEVDPNLVQALIGLGMLADAEKRPKDAIEAYGKALAQNPDNSLLLGRRAFAYALIGDRDHAFADAGAAIKIDPTWIDLYSLRASIDLGREDRDDAMAEMRAAIAVDPKRTFSHVAAARIYAAAGHNADALKEYDAAIAIEPAAYIYSERSRVRPASDQAGRQADVDAAFKLDPKSNDALAARAMAQQAANDHKGAIATWSQLVSVAPDNAFYLYQRATAYLRAGDLDRALADTGSALKLQPKAADIYLLRANLFRTQGKASEAIGTAAALEAAAPDDVGAHVTAANIYSAFHKTDEAMKAYDKAIAIRPEPYIYVNRGENRPKTDLAGRRADFDAALKLAPDMPAALIAKGKLLADNGDLKGAIQIYSAALERSPDNFTMRLWRGIAYALAGDATRAEQDFAAARATATEPTNFNTMCWSKATVGVALASALADCDMALARAPGTANFLDSRAFVLLRLGRNDDAIADYDRALAKNPQLSASLFGRAAAWSRKGNAAKAAADAAAALKINVDIRDEFAGYGITI